MCTICISAAALATMTGSDSAGGLAALAAVRLRVKRRKDDGVWPNVPRSAPKNRKTHAVAIFKLIPGVALAVIPNAGHFALFSEPERVIPLVEDFLKRTGRSISVATAEMSYQPGETR